MSLLLGISNIISRSGSTSAFLAVIIVVVSVRSSSKHCVRSGRRRAPACLGDFLRPCGGSSSSSSGASPLVAVAAVVHFVVVVVCRRRSRGLGLGRRRAAPVLDLLLLNLLLLLM